MPLDALVAVRGDMQTLISAETEIARLSCHGVLRGQGIALMFTAVLTTDGTGTAPVLRIRRGLGTGGTAILTVSPTQAVSTTLTHTGAILENATADDPSFTLTLSGTANLSALTKALLAFLQAFPGT